MAITPAPGDLELARLFVNTLDVDEHTDALQTPATARDWLAANGLMAATDPLKPADHRRLLDVREALRALLLHNSGVDLDPQATRILDEAAQRSRLSVGFGPGPVTRVAARAGGVDGAVGRLLEIVAAAMADGTWQRLKVCLADDCLWGYYDTSRNRSSVWCDMQVCGNRQKVRAFRARHAAAP